MEHTDSHVFTCAHKLNTQHLLLPGDHSQHYYFIRNTDGKEMLEFGTSSTDSLETAINEPNFPVKCRNEQYCVCSSFVPAQLLSEGLCLVPGYPQQR